MAKSLDAWMQHLEQHGLLTLHIEAQKVGCRVRVATSYMFDMEYEGGLVVLATREHALKRFENSPSGMEEARSFLAFASSEIEKARASQGQPGASKMERATYQSAISGPLVIYMGVTRDGKIICVDALVWNDALKDNSTQVEELDNPDGWLDSVDGESVWIAQLCNACGQPFRPIDGYFEEGQYSYCAKCCNW